MFLGGINFKQFLSEHTEWHALVEGLSDGFCVRQSRQLRAEGYFVRAKLIIGEVRYRLSFVDNQGGLLISQIKEGRTLGNLSHGAYEILMYARGWPRKEMPYDDWLKQWKYRRKITRGSQNVA